MSESVQQIERETALELLSRMQLIRDFEDAVAKLSMAGEVFGAAHLSAGQEATEVGACYHLGDGDAITSTHRGHGHALAKGADPTALMAELLGRSTGMSKGKGGSMHISDPAHGFLGANGIVGAGGPLACGAALAAKRRGQGEIALTFFGDGAMVQGGTHESLNLAAALELPVVFVMENNGFAQATSSKFTTKNLNWTDRAHAHGMPALHVDGMDVLAVLQAADEAIDRARSGGGPTFIQADVARYYGHFEGDNTSYVSQELRAEQRRHDPIERFATLSVEQGWLTDQALTDIREQASRTVAEAIEAARAAPQPDPSELVTDVYVDYPVSQLLAK